MRSTLERLFTSLEIASDEYTSRESEQRYNWSAAVNSHLLATLGESDFDGLISAFGAGLTVAVSLREDFPRILEIIDGKPTRSLSEALSELGIEANNTGSFWLTIDINKSVILDALHLAERRGEHHLILFIFRERLCAILSESPTEIEERLFRKPNGGTLIILGDGDDFLTGSILSIIGVNRLRQERFSYTPPDGQVQLQCVSFRQLAADNLSRLGYQFKSLTPLHLVVERHAGEPDAIDSLIAEQLFRCIILYTANRSAQTADKFEAYFAGADQTAKLVFPASLPNAHHDVHNDRLPQLHTLATWTLAKRDVDKLNIMQSIVARTIRVEDPEQAYQRLLSSIPLVLEQANSNYRTFIDNSIDKHFAQVDAAAAYLDSTIQHIGESIDAMTKSLTDSLIAAIGVVIVTILGALAKGEASGQIFQVSMVAYAVYLFFGQAIYKLGSILDSYRMRIREAKEKRVIFEHQLSQSTVDKIYAPLKAREKQFHFWFRQTEVILIGLTIVILCVAAHSDDLAALFLATATP